MNITKKQITSLFWSKTNAISILLVLLIAIYFHFEPTVGLFDLSTSTWSFYPKTIIPLFLMFICMNIMGYSLTIERRWLKSGVFMTTFYILFLLIAYVFEHDKCSDMGCGFVWIIFFSSLPTSLIIFIPLIGLLAIPLILAQWFFVGVIIGAIFNTKPFRWIGRQLISKFSIYGAIAVTTIFLLTASFYFLPGETADKIFSILWERHRFDDSILARQFLTIGMIGAFIGITFGLCLKLIVNIILFISKIFKKIFN